MRQDDFAPQGGPWTRQGGWGDVWGLHGRQFASTLLPRRRAQPMSAPSHDGYWRPTLLTPRGRSRKVCRAAEFAQPRFWTSYVGALDAKR